MPRFQRISFLVLLLVGCLIFAFASPAYGQDGGGTPAPATALPPAPTEANNEAARILERADRASADAMRAMDTVNAMLAFIQASGLLLAVLGSVAAFFGLRTLFDYRSKLTEAQNLLGNLQEIATTASTRQAEMQSLRTDIQMRIAELDSLNADLEKRTRSNLTEMLSMGTQSVRALEKTQLGQQQFSIGNLRQARDTFLEAVTLAPDSRVVHYFLGDVYLRLGELEKGIAQLKLGGAGDPAYPWATVSYAYATRLLGDAQNTQADRDRYYAEAEQLFLATFKDAPELLDLSGESAYGALAGLYRRRKMYGQALHYYEHVSKVTPQNSYPLNNLGILNYMMGHKEKAKQYFREALEIAVEKLSMRRNDIWSWVDRITAEIVLEQDLNQIQDHLSAVFGLGVNGWAALPKFLSGLEEIAAVTDPPAHLLNIIAQLKDSLANRKFMAR
jgi:tetratricopeptide (TPR) repeat protein